MRKFSIGYTVHNLENELVKAELFSLAENKIKPDFIIFHQTLYKRKLINLGKNIFHSHDSENLKLTEFLENVKIYKITDINSSEVKSVFIKYNPAIVICNSGFLKQITIKENPEIIFLNKHCSQLPKYRGVNNVEWALWDRSPVYASIIRIHSGIDEGDILYQIPLEIDFKT
jgi:methionyl-tRNA formyltransferase